YKQFLDSIASSPLLRDRAHEDLRELWDHAQGEFIVALLRKERKASWTSKTQEQILLSLWERFNALRCSYLEWRLKTPDGDVHRDFLPTQQPFTLPSLRGPRGKKEDFPHLFATVSMYSRVLSLLQQKINTMKYYYSHGDTKLQRRKQDIREVVESLSPLILERLTRRLDEKLEEWK